MDKDGETAGAEAPERGETLTLPDAGAQPSPSRELAAGTQVDRYVVVRRLGEGGMGTVWLAEDPELDRPVALKFLRGDGETMSARRRERLKREGRAMAKLAHPNVAVVYDVGTYFGQLFIAMQYVEGGTLRDWMEEGAHSWREVWRMLRPAGEALAAAHESGIVHRDFKPENVLVGDGDRLVVSDFGLAKADGERDDGDEDDSAAPIAPELTGTGARVGTPRYMAPEQHAGQPATAESDQFAFALVLWEALAGAHAFAGEESVDIAASIAAGRRRPWPEQASAPRWVRQRLERALDPDPTRRYPSMRALVDALDRDPVVRRRRWLVAGTIMAVVAGAVTYGVTRSTAAEPSCTDGAESWAGIWDQGASDKLHQAFAATKVSYADDAWQFVARTMNGYVGRWRTAHLSICEATYRKHAQSPALMDREVACLDRLRRQAKTLLDTYSDVASAKSLESIRHFANGLGDLGACTAGEFQAGLPSAPANESDRAEIESIDDLLARGIALREAGKLAEASHAAEESVKRADVIGYAPLLGRALVGLGRTMFKQGEFAGAEKVLKRAAGVASSARDSRGELRAWIALMELAQERTRDPSRVDVLLTAAAAAFQRANPGKQLEGAYFNTVAGLELTRANFAKATEDYRRAEEAWAIAPGKETSYYTNALSNRGNAMVAMGDTDAGIELERKALQATERLEGKSHPDVAEILSLMADARSYQGKYEEAVTLMHRALPILEAEYGTDSPHLIGHYRTLGWSLAYAGRFDESVAVYEHVIDIQHAAGQDNAALVATVGELAVAYVLAHKYEKARQEMIHALDLAENAPRPDEVDVAIQRTNLAELLNMMHRYEEAESHAQRAVDVFAAKPDRSRYLASALPTLGEALLGRGKAAKAIDPLERGISLLKAASADRANLGAARFSLAQAMFSTGKRQRAREVADQAIDDLEAAQATGDLTAETVRNWLAKNHLDG